MVQPSKIRLLKYRRFEKQVGLTMERLNNNTILIISTLCSKVKNPR